MTATPPKILLTKTTDDDPALSESQPSQRRGRPAKGFSAENRILTGALEAFSKIGRADTTVEDILGHAGVSRRTFYRFFKNKDEAFEAVYDYGSGFLIAQVVRAVEAEETSAAKIEAGIEAYLRVCFAAGPITRILILEPQHPKSSLAERHKATLDRFAEIFQNAGERLNRERIDPLIFHGLVAALERVTMELLGDGQDDVERGKRVMLRIVGATLAYEGDKLPVLPGPPE